MRIVPLVNSFSKGNITRKTQTAKFESKNAAGNNLKNSRRTYTGNASFDLAYASMIDTSIANDLKLMGLI